MMWSRQDQDLAQRWQGMAVAQHIIVARARIDGEVTIDVEELDEVEVQADRPFSVGMAYRIYERSTKKEEWRFRVRTALDAGQWERGAGVVQDHAMRSDDQWSNVHTEHPGIPAGEHVLQFEVEASLGQGEWGADSMKTIASETAQGSIRIIAR